MKNILTGIFILIVTVSCMIENGKPLAEKGKLSGIVTYKEAFASAGLADEGSIIYAINEEDVISTKYDNIMNVVENFQINKSEYYMSINNMIDPDGIKKVQENFDAVSGYTVKYISGFTKLPAVARTVTNRTGNYALKLNPGRYYVLVISGNVKSDNIAESRGNIDYKVVDVRSSAETILNASFTKQEMIWIRFITRRQQEGC